MMIANKVVKSERWSQDDLPPIRLWNRNFSVPERVAFKRLHATVQPP